MLTLMLPPQAVVTSFQLESNWNPVGVQLNACYFGRRGAASSIPAKTTLCFTLPQYGLRIHVIVTGRRSVFGSLTPGLAKFMRLVRLTAAMTDGQ